MPKTRNKARRSSRKVRAVRRALSMSGPLTFTAAASTGGEGESGDAPRFSMVAYTGGAMNVGWGDPVVIDFAGLDLGSKSRPVLRDHYPSQVVGHTESVKVDNGSLLIAGVVSGAGEAAREVVESSRRGFPWQASVGVSAASVEHFDAGAKVSVNGRSFTGPIDVVRRGSLSEVSFVALGADDGTVAVAAAKTGVTAMNFSEWLKAKGFNEDDLTKAQRTTLLNAFNAEQAADDEGDDDAEASAEGDDEDDESTDDEGEGDGAAKASRVRANQRRDGRPRVSATTQELRRREVEETSRIAKVRQICRRHPGIEAMAIEQGWTVERAELEVLRAQRPGSPGVRSGGGDVTAAAIEVSLCRSVGVSAKALEESYRAQDLEAADRPELRNFGLHALFAEVTRRAGGTPRHGRMGDEDIRAAFNADRVLQASSGFSTISLSGILSNVANKVLLEAYEAVGSVVSLIAHERDVNDFKEVSALRLITDASFDEVGPGGELKHATLTEQEFANRLNTYGQIVSLDRKTIINDDLDAFLTLPKQMGMRAAARRERLVITALLGAGAFFTDDVNSFDGADTALSIDSLAFAEQKFGERVDPTGEPVLMKPSVLLVAPANKTMAKRIYNSEFVASVDGANVPEKNPFAGTFPPAVSAYLSEAVNIANANNLTWYLFGDPKMAAAIEVLYLRGKRTPTIESGEVDFNKLGMQWRSYFDLGVAMQDPLAVIRMKGEA
ncbi:MAG: hypothetical protein IBJ10_02185 [Phycisphaerales bacterium]|nr:hypothetical protein [Phycisphaerales bacterium]